MIMTEHSIGKRIHIFDDGVSRLFRHFSFFAALTLFIFLLCTISTGAADSGYIDVEGSNSGFVYNDKMLLVNQNQMSTDLAKASMVLSLGAYSSKPTSMLQSMGYTATSYNYGEQKLTDELVAYTIGYRDVPASNIRIICVVVRGTQEISEWISNFNIRLSGDHVGFKKAADDLDSVLPGYLDSGRENILWFTGHSRGAAVANILAARYTGIYKTFGYTFACPAVSTSIQSYDNIWNFNNSRDIVPKVPPAAMGYSRNGHDYSIYWPSNATEDIEEKINKVIEMSGDYEDPLNRFRLSCIGYFLSGSTDVSVSELIRMYGDIPELESVEDLSNVNSLELFEKKIQTRHDQYSENEQYIREIQAFANEMTEEEFTQYLATNSDVRDRIYTITNIQIQQKADLGTAMYHMISLVKDLATSETALEAVFSLVKAGKDLLGEIKSAHSSDKYTNHINHLFFGYAAEKNGITERIALPDNITTIGPYCFENSQLSWISMPNVVYIGKQAFCRCNSMEDLIISDRIEGLGEESLAGMKGLRSLTLPVEYLTRQDVFCRGSVENGTNGLTTLHVTKGKTGVMSPADKISGKTSWTYVPDLIHMNSKTLTRVVLDEGITNIADYVFYDGWGATADLETFELNIPSTVTSIGQYAFYNHHWPSGSLTVPAAELGQYCFAYMDMTELTLSEELTSLPKGAFFECAAVTELTIPDSIESLGEESLAGMKGLRSLTLPVEYLTRQDVFCRAYAEVGTDGLTTLHVTKGKTGVMSPAVKISGYTSWDDVPDLIHMNSKTLTCVVLDEGITNIADYVFYDKWKATADLETFELNIPSTVTSIGQYAFYNRHWPEKGLIIPETVTSIGEQALSRMAVSVMVFPDTYGYSYVTENHVPYIMIQSEGLVLPDQLKVVEEDAFCHIGAPQVMIPQSVESICAGAFADSNIHIAIFKGQTCDISPEAFSGCVDLCVICVRNSEIEAWARENGYTIYNLEEVQRSTIAYK